MAFMRKLSLFAAIIWSYYACTAEGRILQVNDDSILENTDIPSIATGSGQTVAIVNPDSVNASTPIVASPDVNIPDNSIPNAVASLNDTATTGVLPSNIEVVTVSVDTPAGELDNIGEEDPQPYNTVATVVAENTTLAETSPTGSRMLYDHTRINAAADTITDEYL